MVSDHSEFYLDDPLGSPSAIQNLYKYTNTYKDYLGLLNTSNVLWIKTSPPNVLEDSIESSLSKVRVAIQNPDQVIVFWAAENNITLEETLVKRLNDFSASLPNPVMFLTGILGDWIHDWNGKLKFTVVPLMYFEYESCISWDKSDSIFNVNRTKKFLSMGTKDYPVRKYILSNILTGGFKDDGYVSYARHHGSGMSPAHYTPEQHDDMNMVASRADAWMPMPQIDDYPDSWTKMPRDFLTNSYLNMVTDTFYDVHGNYTFISEKVYNAMIHQQMFIMLSPRHTLKFLRDNGFKTFGDFIDESYDEIESNYDRLNAVNNAFINFIGKPIEEIREIYIKCLPILEHNRQLVESKRLPSFLLSEIQRAINEKAQIK